MATIRPTGLPCSHTHHASPDRFTRSKEEPLFDLQDRLELTSARAAEIEKSLGQRVPGEILVKLPQGMTQDQMKSLAADYGAELQRALTIPQVMRESFDGELAVLSLPPSLTEAGALAVLETDQRVKMAATNDLMQLANTPNDLHPEQWNLKNEGRFGVVGADIDAERAWDITTGDRVNGPIVAVIDSGIDVAHPDLRPNLWRNPDERFDGRDTDRNGIVDDVFGVGTKNNTGNIVDHLGHGSHVAGIIGAVGDNGKGVVGVNWETRMMGLKVADGSGRVSMVGAIFSTLYAADKGAKIANNSWGGPIHNPILEDVMRASPMLHVCAAGNAQRDTDVEPFFPAAYDLDNVISVGASTKRDVALYFSNWGADSVDLHAPGALVYSTLPRNEYNHESGTSMAAPHVAGVAALIATAYPDASLEEIKNRLIYSADPLPDLHGKSVSGGRLNAYRALLPDDIPPGPLGHVRFEELPADGFDLNWVTSGDDGMEGQLNHIELLAFVDGERNRLVADRPGPPGSEESFQFRLTPVPFERQLEVTARGIDKVGNSSPTVTLEGTIPAGTTVLYDDGSTDLPWQTESWARVEEEGRGRVWTDTPDGGYEDSTEYDLVSPPLDLSSKRSTTVTFDAKMKTEKWDFLWVEASRDGGQDYEHFLGVVRGDSPREWTSYSMDLSEFDGEADVRLRFRFRTSNSGTDDGVYLDNIRVIGAEPQA